MPRKSPKKSKRESKAEQNLSKSLKKIASKRAKVEQYDDFKNLKDLVEEPLKLIGHTADAPRYRRNPADPEAGKQRLIDIEFDDGQKLTVASEHMVPDQEVAVVVLEKPEGYSVKIEKA